MKRFKIGDKVKVNNKAGVSFSGWVGVITKIYGDSDYCDYSVDGIGFRDDQLDFLNPPNDRTYPESYNLDISQYSLSPESPAIKKR